MMYRLAIDCEQVLEELYAQFSQCPGVYVRCNVSQGMQAVSWIDAGSLSAVAAHTNQYLQLDDTSI